MDIISFVTGFQKGKASAAAAGAELKIVYGEVPPADTSSLWIKTTEPSRVIVSDKVEYVGDVFNYTHKILSENMLDNIYDMGCAVVGRKVYLFGGKVNVGNATNVIRCFNTETKKFDPISATLPYVVQSIGCAAVGNKVYLFGGTDYQGTNHDEILCFDTTTEEFIPISEKLPATCATAACARVGSAIYIFGVYAFSAPVYIYDTEKGTISTSSATINDSMSAGVAKVGNKVYLFGGRGSSATAYRAYIRVYDTESNTRAQLENGLGTTGTNSFCACYGDRVYVFGHCNSGTTGNCYCFNTETGEVTNLQGALPTPTADAGIATVGDKIYLFGGTKTPTTIQEFSPAIRPKVENGTLHIVTVTGEHGIPLVTTDAAVVEIGVKGIYKGNSEGVGESVEAYTYKDGEWQPI